MKAFSSLGVRNPWTYLCTNKVKFYFKKLINPIAKTLMQNIEEHLFDADIADTGAPVGFKTWWGYQYMVCIICSPSVNRVGLE